MTTPLKILVVEDHDDLRDVTVAALAHMGHTARGVCCAEEIDEIPGNFQPDIFLLDLNLPGEDGLSVARRLRAARPRVGIIMVTARDQARDTRQGYDAGADIYITKPTSPEELDAAIRALDRRLRPSPPAGMILDNQRLCLRGPCGDVNISNTDFRLLSALSVARDHRLETWQILEILGKEVNHQEKKSLTVHMVRLRKKLNDAGAPEPTIKSIRGEGYQLCLPLAVQ